MTDMKDVFKAEDERLLKEVKDIAGKRHKGLILSISGYLEDIYDIKAKNGKVSFEGCNGEEVTLDSLLSDIADASARAERYCGDEYGTPNSVLEYMARNELDRFRKGKSYGDDERQRELLSELFGTF